MWLLVIAENEEGVGEGEGRGQGGGEYIHDREYHYEMTDLPTTPTMMELHMMITSVIHEFSISMLLSFRGETVCRPDQNEF